MKKRFFLATVIACMALTASAQAVQGLIFPINTVTSTTVTVNGQRVAGSGAWHARILYRTGGSFMFTAGAMVNKTAGQSTISIVQDSLVPNTTYEFALQYFDAAYTDSFTTPVQLATTSPAPTQATMAFTSLSPMLPASRAFFSHNAPGFSWRVFAKAAPSYLTVCTDTVIVTGIGIDTFLSIPNSALQSVPGALIVFEPVVPQSGLTVGQANGWSAYQAPGYTKSRIVSLDTVLTWVDSVAIRSTDSIGNGGPMMSTVEIIDPNGTVLQSWNKTQAASGTFFISRAGLVPNTSYTVKQKGFTSGVFQDSATLVVKTRQVPAPTGAIAGIGYGKTSTSFFVNWNSRGTWATSAVDTIFVYENGTQVAAYPKFLTGTGMQTVSRTGLSAGTAHVYQVYVRNLAGLQTLLTTTITTDPYVSEPAPQWGNPVGNDATTVKLSNVYVTVTQGDVAELIVRYRRDQDASYGTPQVAMGNLQSSATVSPIVSGLEFSTKYWFQIGVMSQDGIPTWNAQEKYALTPNAGNPVVEDIIVNASTGSTLSGTLMCNGQGMLAQAKTEVWSLASGTPTFLQGNAWNTGSTGAFTRFFSFMSVPTGVNLEIRGYASEVPTNNVTEMSKFVTITPTGIEKIEPEEALKQVIGCAWDLEGRLLGEGLLDDLRKVRYGQIVLIGYREVRYQKLHPTEKIFVQ